MDMIMDNSSISDISDRVKEILYSKSAEKIEVKRPEVASSMFDYSSGNQ